MDFDTVNSLKEKGNKAFVAGNYDDALVFYKDALKSAGSGDSKDPKIAAILHSNIAQAYLQKKDYSTAVESATESLKLDPSFMKSNLRRAIGNVELDNLADAMNDLRVVFSLEPKNKAAKDLMRRCSDKTKMKRELHDLYAKHYLRQKLKKSGNQSLYGQDEMRPIWLQNALLRQLFLSSSGLDISNTFFRGATVDFKDEECAAITFHKWIARQVMWLKYSYSPTKISPSVNLFNLLYRLLRSKTFSLDIYYRDSTNDKTLLLNKYLDVFLSTEMMLAGGMPLNENDLNVMNYYSNDLTRFYYHPGLANFKKNKFPKAKTMAFSKNLSVSSDFLKLWKKREWPVESLSLIGVPDFQCFKQFNGIVSSKVNTVFIQLLKGDYESKKASHNNLCSNLSILKNVFPNLSDVTIQNNHGFKVLEFPTFVQDVALIHEAYETFSAKPEWCPKLKVMIFVEFYADSKAEFKMFDAKLLERAVKSLRQKHPEMQARLCGPRSYDAWCGTASCAHAVIEFENEVAQFELAIHAVALI